MVVCERRDLREVRHDNHLRGSREPRQPSTNLDGCGPSNPRIHLVKHEGWHRIHRRNNHLESKHDSRELATRGTLCERPRRCTGVGLQEQLHVVCASAAGLSGDNLNDEPGIGKCEFAQFFADQFAEGGSRSTPGGRQRLCQILFPSSEFACSLLEEINAFVVALELGEALDSRSRVCNHPSLIGTKLAKQTVEQCKTLVRPSKLAGALLIEIAGIHREFSGRIADLSAQTAQCVCERRELRIARGHPIELPQRGVDEGTGICAERVTRICAESKIGCCSSRPQFLKVAEPSDVSPQLVFLSWLRIDGGDHFEFLAQLSRLPGTLISRCREIGDFGSELAPLRVRSLVVNKQSLQFPAAEAIDHLPLGRRAAKPQLLTLPVYGKQPLSQLGERSDWCRRSSHTRTTTTLGAYCSSESEVTVRDVPTDILHKLRNEWISGANEPAHACRVGAGTDRARVRAVTHEEPQCSDDHRLSRTGLASDCGEPRAKLKRGVSYDSQISNAQLFDHGAAFSSGAEAS